LLLLWTDNAELACTGFGLYDIEVIMVAVECPSDATLDRIYKALGI